MATERQAKALDTYSNLMEEIKVRQASINDVSGGGIRFFPPLAREYCFLQLRMICELIALACLVAHGDIKETQGNKLQKEYSAERIISLLGHLHKDFYPEPCKQVKTGPNSYDLPKIVSGFLTKQELILLYRQCGQVLHRGNIKMVLKGHIEGRGDFSDVAEQASKIVVLLNHHTISLFDGRTRFVCGMSMQELGGRVQTAFFERRD